MSREGDSQDPPETTALEDIQFRIPGPSECPDFGAIHEDWKNVRHAQEGSCVDTDAGLPNPKFQIIDELSL